MRQRAARARAGSIGWIVAGLACLGCAGRSVEPRWVDVEQIVPDIETDIRYAGTSNFVGDVIDGYRAPRCLLSVPAAEALACAQRRLRRRGLGLRVYDCYRPQRAVDHFVRWAEDLSDQREKAAYYPHVDKARLFDDGYIARRSGHSRGSTVDLTLVPLSEDPERPVDRAPLDMGTPFDFFDPASHTETEALGVTEDARRNRFLLRGAMETCGFRNLPEEWWHYSLRDEPYPDRYFDLPIE